jgi:hypothetical protein
MQPSNLQNNAHLALQSSFKRILPNLEERKIGEYGPVPRSIWKFIHHFTKPPHIQELHCKLVFNALPLAGHASFFTQEENCYACPGVHQDIKHFASTCWTARVLWQLIRSLDAQVHQTGNWIMETSDHLYGGVTLRENPLLIEWWLLLHGIALETLWLTFTRIYEQNCPCKAGIQNMCKQWLHNTLETLQECHRDDNRFPFSL